MLAHCPPAPSPVSVALLLPLLASAEAGWPPAPVPVVMALQLAVEPMVIVAALAAPAVARKSPAASMNNFKEVNFFTAIKFFDVFTLDCSRWHIRIPSPITG